MARVINIGKTTQLSDLSSYGKYSSRDYHKTFGSLNNFLVKIREPLLKRDSNFTKEDLILKYHRQETDLIKNLYIMMQNNFYILCKR